MARDKKFINYTFDDGEYKIPATYTATCIVSGEKVVYYHKNLVKLIETKYKNNFKLFVDTFISPSAKKEEQELHNQDKYKLNIYAYYLIICYNDAVKKNDEYSKFVCSERFEKHFNKDILNHLNDTYKA
jgi:hypothetical protein